VIGVIVMGLY